MLHHHRKLQHFHSLRTFHPANGDSPRILGLLDAFNNQDLWKLNDFPNDLNVLVFMRLWLAVLGCAFLLTAARVDLVIQRIRGRPRRVDRQSMLCQGVVIVSPLCQAENPGTQQVTSCDSQHLVVPL